MKIKKNKSEANNQLSNKLKSYSALTGAFLAATGAADAQIVYHDVIPDAIVHNGLYNVDMDGDGITDFIINQYSVTGSQSYKTAGITADSNHFSNRVIIKGATINQYFVSLLPAGAVIGPAVTNFKTMQQGLSNVFPMGSHFYTNSYGPWPGKSGFAGVEFKTNGNTFYGWIECYVALKADSVIIKGWAYDTVPGAVINSGDSGSATGIGQGNAILNHVGNFYPNAVKYDRTFIEIDSKDAAELKIELMNGMGEFLRTEQRKLKAGKNIVQLNVEQITNGIYFVKLTQGKQYYFRKLIVKR